MASKNGTPAIQRASRGFEGKRAAIMHRAFDIYAAQARRKLERVGIPIETKFKASQTSVPDYPVKPATMRFGETFKTSLKEGTRGEGEVESPAAFVRGKRILLAQSLPELRDCISRAGLKPFRASQLQTYVYKQGVFSFKDMRLLSNQDREILDATFTVGTPDSIIETTSSDGTRKCLLGFSGSEVGPNKKAAASAQIECVFIPETSYLGPTDLNEEDHILESGKATLCVSSQVGCSLSCTFCHTGTQKLERNLESWEMVAQVLHGKKIAGDFHSEKKHPTLRNIVLMGQGEPLYNFRNLKPFVQTVVGPMNFHPSRITLSTSGVAPLIPRIATDLHGISLAISLHATTDALRDKIMPINKQYPLDALFASIRDYIRLRSANSHIGKRHKRVTFEYVLLKGVNDSLQDAERLVRLIQSQLRIGDMRELNRLAHVNLIPFHPWHGSTYECSLPEEMDNFRNAVESAGIHCHVRASRGEDILGACGQLRSSDQRKDRISSGSAVI